MIQGNLEIVGILTKAKSSGMLEEEAFKFVSGIAKDKFSTLWEMLGQKTHEEIHTWLEAN